MVRLADDNTLVALFRFNAWANARLFDACASLTDDQLDATAPGTYGSIRGTLVHIVANDENYLGILTSRWPAEPFRRGVWPGFAALRERAAAAEAGLTEVAARTNATTAITQMFQGQPTTVQAGIVLIQAIDHAAEHRTHITTILTQQGITPPMLDGWAFGEAPPD